MLGVVLVAAAVVAALFATSAIGGKPSSTARHNGGGARAASALHATAFNPRSVTVAVLNGTGTAGLAGRTSKRLTAGGYKPGTVATASDQTQTKTVVGYLPGHRADGVQVATALKLPATSVQPVTSSAQAVACPPPSPCSANVVITVGADLASS